MHIVQMMIVQRLDDRIEQAFEFVEIHDGADGIDRVAGDGGANAPIVPMQGFEGAIIKDKLMGGGEFAGSGDVEGHGGDCMIAPAARQRG